VTATTLRQLSRIALALLVMTGRMAMLGMSHWAGKACRHHREDAPAHSGPSPCRPVQQ